MADSKRFKPFINNRRECNVCHIEKEKEEFIYSKTTGYYSGYCRECNKIIRTLYNPTSEQKKKEKSEYVKKYYKNIINKASKIISSYKQLDKKKGFITNLTKEFVINSLLSNCIYCDYPSIGLDRIDNNKPHLDSNCVPCCKECNIARMNNFSHEEMKIIGKAIKEVKNKRI